MKLSEEIKIYGSINGTIGKRLKRAGKVVRARQRLFTPIGPTGQLRESITDLKPFKRGTQLIAIQAVKPRDSRVFKYARIQVTANLRHFGQRGNFFKEGFSSLGTSGKRLLKYAQGYRKAIKTGQFQKFPTNFMKRGLSESKPEVLQILNGVA